MADPVRQEREARMRELSRRSDAAMAEYRRVMSAITAELPDYRQVFEISTESDGRVSAVRIDDISIRSLTPPQAAASALDAVRVALVRFAPASRVGIDPEDLLQMFRDGASAAQVIAESARDAGSRAEEVSVFGTSDDVQLILKAGRLDDIVFDQTWFETAGMGKIEVTIRDRLNEMIDASNGGGRSHD